MYVKLHLKVIEQCSWGWMCCLISQKFPTMYNFGTSCTSFCQSAFFQLLLAAKISIQKNLVIMRGKYRHIWIFLYWESNVSFYRQKYEGKKAENTCTTITNLCRCYQYCIVPTIVHYLVSACYDRKKLYVNLNREHLSCIIGMYSWEIPALKLRCTQNPFGPQSPLCNVL